MKKLLFVLLTGLVSTGIFAQSYPVDIATTGMEVRNATNTANIGFIGVGQVANFRFSIFNAGTNPAMSIPAGTVEAVVSVPETATPYAYTGPLTVTGTGNQDGAYFTFTYLPADHVLYATNAIAIPNGGYQEFIVQVTGTAIGTASTILNLTQNGVSSNNTSNDNGSAPLQVTGVVPVKFNDISAEASDCSAKLKWSTSMEEPTTTFDVEYSPDGRNFVKVADVAGKKIATGSAYEYAYNQGNGKGYYRLKMGNAEGGYQYSKVVNANIKCNAKKVFIYPNPIKTDEILHVNVSNYEGTVTGTLMTDDGRALQKTTLVNGSNLVKLNSLPQGTYNYRVTDDRGGLQNYKVVVIK